MSTIEIHRNSITCLKTDVIVNAANSSLAVGGGVCGAIFAAAGIVELSKECKRYGHCPTGSAVITSSCNLKDNKYIIHAVGPCYRGGKNGEAEQLYSCYICSLTLAKENFCHSIGFPLISSGIYGYPKEEAWRVALTACSDFICDNPDYEINIIFVSPNQNIVEMGKEIYQNL